MSSIGSGYDLSADMFSPDGRVFQVEYAMKAVENGATIVGLRCKDGVVLATEKLISSSLHTAGDNSRIFKIDDHIGMAAAGLLPDARSLTEILRDEATKFRREFGRPIPLKVLCHTVASYVHQYTRHSSIRPFGCTLLLSTFYQGKAELWTIDPSGAAFGFKGAAAGKAKNNAKTEIEKLDLDNLTVKEGLKEAARIIHSVHDDLKDKTFELELSWVSADNPKHNRVPKEVAEEVEAAAKAALEDSDSEDDM
ncbi:unnamed protein product [Oikopleura dioica]|jgi:20S proteasome subunit alpha 7|uniref:Proteasome alpha-type subunits domain-containing protein n=1 Tax=Oikopleura dioica TaxID=34765 RepID=E4XWH0_OIKDI|nr:unnamed protein product [Oikopleura dioica]